MGRNYVRRGSSKVALDSEDREILRFIKKYIYDYGYSPTVENISEALDISPGTINEAIKWLVKKDYLTKVPRIPRSIRLGEASTEVL